MSSSWGNSWGTSWGSSWDIITINPEIIIGNSAIKTAINESSVFTLTITGNSTIATEISGTSTV